MKVTKEQIQQLRERAEHVRECAHRADRTDDFRREMKEADALFAQVAELEKELAA
jgi:hypothetical protein